MSLTTLKRIGIALAVAVFLYGVVAVVNRRASDEIETVVLPALSAADVDRILIQRSGDTIDLATADGAQWMVNGFRADPTRVQELFSALRDAASGGELVARNASSHARMGVDDAGGRRLTFLKSGQPVADMIIGSSAAAARSGFLRQPGSDNVFMVHGMLNALMGREANDWRDRHVAVVPTDSIGSVRVERREGNRMRGYTVTRADSVNWTVDGAPADSAEVQRMLGALRNVEGSGFPKREQVDSITFASPYRALTVFGRDGSRLLALLFDSIAGGPWVRHDSGGPIYRFDRWRLDGLMPADSVIRRD